MPLGKEQTEKLLQQSGKALKKVRGVLNMLETLRLKKPQPNPEAIGQNAPVMQVEVWELLSPVSYTLFNGVWDLRFLNPCFSLL